MSAVFDAVADTYDERFTHTVLGRWLRTSVREHLSEYFTASDLVLELGCGTGEDALWLAQQGFSVHATDVSRAMLEETRRKANSQGVSDNMAVSRLDLEEIDGTSPPPPPSVVGIDRTIDAYDGVLANFGVLNCLDGWRDLSEGLAHVVRPGGIVIAVVMGPFCPWEWGWFLSHGKPRKAFRRLRGRQSASIGADTQLEVRYPSPGTMKRSFAPQFVHRSTAGIGVLLPPSYGKNLVERRRQWFATVVPWDRRFGRTFPGTWLNDHYLMVWERSV